MTPAAGLDVGELAARRAASHRLAGAEPMDSVEELGAFIGAVGLALVSGRGALPSAAEAIAAGPIEGSWWAHPQGHRIYRLLSELEQAHDGGLELALFDGKRTLVSPSLAPIVKSLAADADRRRRVVDGLPVAARRLWERLDAGEVVGSNDGRLDRSAWRQARAALEAGLLARSTGEHTTAGRHIALLEAFDPAPAGAEGSLTAVVRAALAAAVVAERRHILRAFRAVEPDARLLEEAVEATGARSIPAEGRTWLTLATASS